MLQEMNLDKNKAREEARAKINLAKQRKREMVDKIEKRLKEAYEKETGLSANYTFTM